MEKSGIKGYKFLSSYFKSINQVLSFSPKSMSSATKYTLPLPHDHTNSPTPGRKDVILGPSQERNKKENYQIKRWAISFCPFTIVLLFFLAAASLPISFW